MKKYINGKGIKGYNNREDICNGRKRFNDRKNITIGHLIHIPMLKIE